MLEFLIFGSTGTETIQVDPAHVITVSVHPMAGESSFYGGLYTLTMRDGRQLNVYDPAGDAVEKIRAAQDCSTESAPGKMITIADPEQWEMYVRLRAAEHRIASLYDSLQERDELIARLQYLLAGDLDEGEEWKE